MVGSFIEIGKKAEAIMEKGREADQELQNCQQMVSLSSNRVASARLLLFQASETDENGNPKGNVSQARAMLSMAEQQLEASRRKLDAARTRVDEIRRQKRSQVRDIESYSQAEMSNLEKLQMLRKKAFGSNVAAMIEGLADRVNEADAIRVQLLRSMGVEAMPNRTSSGSSSGVNVYGGGVSNKSMSVATGNAFHKNGSDESFGGGMTVPLGGALPSDLNNSGIAASSSLRQQHIATLKGLKEQLLLAVKSAQETQTASLLRTQRIAELKDFKEKLLLSNQISEETDGTKTHNKKSLSPDEQLRRGQAYVDSIVDVYRDILIDQGAIPSPEMDVILSDLKRHYLNELHNEINGQPSGLYNDPDFAALVAHINSKTSSSPVKIKKLPIADVFAGKDMTFEEADSGHVNPDYGKKRNSDINCQVCVVAFEARQRGYDVQALPYKHKSEFSKLSSDPKLAWIDPKSGTHPEYIYNDSLLTAEDYMSYVDDIVQVGERYTIQFEWKGFGHFGHIINVDRTSDGILRFKDNQRGSGEKSEWIGYREIGEYMSRFKYRYIGTSGDSISCVPKLLRIDNMDFNYELVNKVMKGT